jgi:hypothetical protein
MKVLRFRLARYRAFQDAIELELAPITIIIGRNHTGKSSLLRAPWLASQPFSRQGAEGLLYADPSNEPIPLLSHLAWNRSPRGFEAGFTIEQGGQEVAVDYQATSLPERQQVERLRVRVGERLLADRQDLGWAEAYPAIEQAQLTGLHDEVDLLCGIRAAPRLSVPLRGVVPRSVGFDGARTVEAMAAFAPDRVVDWAQAHLGLRLHLLRDHARAEARVEVEGPDGVWVNLVEAGTGVSQVLPVAVSLLLLPRLPALFCLEHPELYLHPDAHRGVAELLISARHRQPDSRLLVESHSDTLVLRLRRAIVEGRLEPDDVRLYVVDQSPRGATCKAIHFNDRGVPDWWPQGVFSEAQAEYQAMRRVLAGREVE